VTNGIPLGSSLLLPVHTVNSAQTLQAHNACTVFACEHVRPHRSFGVKRFGSRYDGGARVLLLTAREHRLPAHRSGGCQPQLLVILYLSPHGMASFTTTGTTKGTWVIWVRQGCLMHSSITSCLPKQGSASHNITWLLVIGRGLGCGTLFSQSFALSRSAIGIPAFVPLEALPCGPMPCISGFRVLTG
jgi:hypothetical protein